MKMEDDLEFSINLYYKKHLKDDNSFIDVFVDKLYYTDKNLILFNYHSLEHSKVLYKAVGGDNLLKIEKILNKLKHTDNITKDLFVLKTYYSKNIVVQKQETFSEYYYLKEYSKDIKEKFLFTKADIKKIKRNKSVFYEYYFVPLKDVLIKSEYKEGFIHVYKDNYIDTNLFEDETGADYYNTVRKIRTLIDENIDSFRNNVKWVDNILEINKNFIIEFYETHISFDLHSLEDKKLQKELSKIIRKYNDSTHKVVSKYVVVNTKENVFYQSLKTPSGEFNIFPLSKKTIYAFDENCIFYLDEIVDKFPEHILAKLYLPNSYIKIIRWDDIEKYKDVFFEGLSQNRFEVIVAGINGISKRVV